MKSYLLNDPESDFQPTYIPKFKNSKQFVEEKLKMLINHFRIFPTSEEIDHLYELKTESDINAAIRTILNNHWK